MARALTTWDPFRDLEEVRERFNRMMGGMDDSQELAPGSLSLDVIEEDNQFRVVAPVPGMRPEDIDIRVENNVLTIKGEHREEQEQEEGDYLRRELRYGSFHRSLRLPSNADTENIDANVEDGMLTLQIPKREEARARSIQVKAKGQLPQGDRQG